MNSYLSLCINLDETQYMELSLICFNLLEFPLYLRAQLNFYVLVSQETVAKRQVVVNWVILSQKCYINMYLIHNSYKDIQN